jgi:hypothetical protein
MIEDRLNHHEPSAFGISANAGVMIERVGDRWFAAPNRHADDAEPPAAPFILPSIPPRVIESCMPIMRLLQSLARPCIWLLYLDQHRHSWSAMLPPQLVSPGGYRADLGFSGDVAVPGPELRLAASLTTRAHAPPEDMATELPAFEGIHLVWHGFMWGSLSAFISSGGQTFHVPPEAVIAEIPDAATMELMRRIRMANHV